MKKLLAAVLIAGCTANAFADISESDLADLTGYTIIGAFTVTGYKDSKKGKTETSFEGCDYDRIIILDDSKAVKCAEYSYSYSYRPKAVVLTDGSTYKMIVNGHIYRVTAL